jgi:nicotinamidase-related amidase
MPSWKAMHPPRFPLTLLTGAVPPLTLSRAGTIALLQDAHAPFTDFTDGALAREAARRFVLREFDEYAQALPSAIARAAALLAAARAAGIRVHHVTWATAASEAPTPLSRALGWTWAPDDRFPEGLAPAAGDVRHLKGGWSALTSPTLRAALAGVETVILAGFPFDFGVRHSALALADAGIAVLLAEDATAPITAACGIHTRGMLAHGLTKLRSSAEITDLLARLPSEGRVWV